MRAARPAGVGLVLAGLLAGCAGASSPAGTDATRAAPSARASGSGGGTSHPSSAAEDSRGGRVLRLPPDAQPAEVVRHVDGDTLVLTGIGRGVLPGRPTRVRLLHIDTPEVFEQPECYGQQAADRTAELLPVGARLRVRADVDPRDRFGRTLLLAWTEQGAGVQEALLAEGAARVLAVGRNRVGLQQLRAVERQAQRERRGLWGAC